MSSEITKIKKTLSTVKDPIVRERLLMVKDSYSESLRDVARRFGYAHGKIAYWKKRYEMDGLRGLYTKSRSGRPKKLNPQQEKKIKRRIKKHNPKQGWRTTHIRSVILEESGIKYSYRQVLRITQSWGLSQITPRPRSAYSKKEDREEFIKKTKNSYRNNHQNSR
jgi:transposase